jgi:hypothetical protein
MLDEVPKIAQIMVSDGQVSDEVDYFVNTYLAEQRGFGLTACQPALVQLESGEQAIRFKLDSTFVDAVTNNVKGYGLLGTDEGFVGELLLSYNPEDVSDMRVLFITPQEEIEHNLQQILANPEKFPATERPRDKY